MGKSDKGSPRGLPRITRVELTEKNFALRVILLALALVIAISAFGVAITSMLNTDPGWKQIESESDQLNCSQDFVLNYYLGASGVSATAEQKQLVALYTKATEDAFRIFSMDYEAEQLFNISYVNDHINQDITVDPVLYEAFRSVQSAKNRSIYLAPIYVEYEQMFIIENAQEAERYDPGQNAELLAYVTETASYANDPEMIDIVLLGENKIRLQVSDAYLTYAEENGIEEFIDFSWMKNAFIADYIAELLMENGFTYGYISSYDGFTRNLDVTDTLYTMNVFDRLDNEIFMPARMHYQGRKSIVFLRNYPMGQADRWHYYSFPNGRISSVYVDPTDGVVKSSVNNLIAYSEKASCVDVLMAVAPVYLTDTLDVSALTGLKEQDIFTLYGKDQVLYYNDSDLNLEMLQDLEVSYSKQFFD